MPCPSSKVDLPRKIGKRYVLTLSQFNLSFVRISVEVIRIGQSLWISWDAQMYHDATNTPARAR